MLFNSFSFIILFPILFLLYYVIPAKHNRIRNSYLLIVSYLLYMNWKPSFALVLLFVTVVTYLGARILGNRNLINKKKLLITVFAILALVPLIFFKYYNFINESITSLLSFIGLEFSLPGLNLIIPVGISYFTFQALGYLWDVYRKRIAAEKDFLDYALFVSFFPSIVSGPINKASLLLPQIKSLRPYFNYSKAVEGMKMVIWGMFMKVVVADRIAIYVETVFPEYQNFTAITCIFTCCIYLVQIYADFAGYSLMAIGIGKTLGFELTENFRRPLFAVSITDFWKRWHISLSTWLKDYVYIPLGGSHCSKLRNYFNIFITFLICGIWHGASLTLVAWGAVHGTFQILEKIVGQQKCNYGAFGRTIKIIITFLLISFTLAFFRMPTLDDTFGFIHHMFDFSDPQSLYVDAIMFAFMAIGIFILFTKDIKDEFFPNSLKRLTGNSIVRWCTYLCLTVYIILAGVFSADQFIYAQF